MSSYVTDVLDSYLLGGTMKNLIRYLLIAFGGAWVLQAVAIVAMQMVPAELQTAVFQIPVAVSMLVPLLAVIIVSKGISPTKTGIKWGIHLKGRIKWIFIAFFGPLVFTLVGATLYFAIFNQDLTLEGGFITAQYPPEVLEQLPFSPSFLVLISLVSALTYGPLINMFFAAGEEAGWRGFMVPLLMQKLGRKGGLLLGGVIWGAWHWPIIIFAGYQYGIGYFGAPFSGMAGMCLFTIALGILLQMLYEKTDCIWIPALAHGALNAVAGLPLYFMPADTTNYLLGPTLAGLIPVLPLLVVALVVFIIAKPRLKTEP